MDGIQHCGWCKCLLASVSARAKNVNIIKEDRKRNDNKNSLSILRVVLHEIKVKNSTNNGQYW
jgi:hypothetical protein